MEGMKEIMQEDGKRELEKLLRWITQNRKKWQYICNPEFLELPVQEKLELIESLESAGLYSVAYIVFSSAWSRSQPMEAVRDQFINELIAELAPEQLLGRMKNAMRECVADADNEAEM